MLEFEKYLTGDNDTEQKNINDGAAILTAPSLEITMMVLQFKRVQSKMTF